MQCWPGSEQAITPAVYVAECLPAHNPCATILGAPIWMKPVTNVISVARVLGTVAGSSEKASARREATQMQDLWHRFCHSGSQKPTYGGT